MSRPNGVVDERFDQAGFEIPFAEAEESGAPAASRMTLGLEIESPFAEGEATEQADSWNEAQAEDYEAPLGEDEAFPSGLVLQPASGATGRDEEHWDPQQSGNPLLTTGPDVQAQKISPHFTVRELVTSGGKAASVARISPELVRVLELIRERAGRPVRITSGYRSWARNKQVYAARGKKPTDSQHCSGQAADISVSGMSGLELGKLAIDAAGTSLAIGIGRTFIHVDVRGKWAVWSYFPRGGEADRKAVAELSAHRARALGGAKPKPAPMSPRPHVPQSAPMPTGGADGRLVVATHPMLRSHRGTSPDLILRWHRISQPGDIDVIVHFHGYGNSGQETNVRIDRDKEAISGLDFSNPEAPGTTGRTRPSLAILPRGNYFGGSRKNAYNFPALTPKGALLALIQDALARVTQATGHSVRMGRLILTGHSGGGAPLTAVLAHTEPDEIHVFDGLYGSGKAIGEWAERRIARDLGSPAVLPPAMRILYRPGSKQYPGTQPHSEALARQLSPALSAPEAVRLRPFFRVEMTRVDHNSIPARFGWRLLADAGADVPDATAFTGTAQPSREALEFGADDESLAWLDVEALGEAVTAEDQGEGEGEGEDEEQWEAESAYEEGEGAQESEAADEGESEESADVALDSLFEAEDFPSGKTLSVTTGPSQIGDEFFDPYFTQNPLLDVSGSKASTKLSAHFTAGEFARSGSVKFPKARIDPALVKCLEEIRVFLKTSVTILDGYYSFKHLTAVSKQRGIAQPPATPHLSGRGARFQAGGLTGVELAKAAVVCCPNDTSIAIGETSVSVYVKQTKPEVTSFIKNGEAAERAIHLIRQYRLLFFSDAAMLAATRTDLHGIRLFVHSAIHKHQLRDENILFEIAFYKSDYVKEKRDRAKVYGKFDKTKPVDLALRKEIIEKTIKPELGEVVGPPSQRGGVPTTPKDERKPALPQPDRVPLDITGRYEAIHSDKSEELGKTMCINQAGTHIEVAISPVNSPAAPANRTRYTNRYYGTLEASGAWKIFSRESALDIIRLVPRTGGLNFEWKSGDRSGTEVYRRISDSPFLTEQAISTFDKVDRPLLEAYETRPLLQSQIGLLRGIFADPDRIGKLLNDFYHPKCDPIQQWDEFCQGQATKAFGKVKKWLNDPARGYHPSDRALALFYTRHYLTYNRWRPTTKYPYLSALDWAQRAVSVVEYQSKHHPNRTGTTDASALTGDLVDIMGLKTAADSDGHVHTYKMTMKLYGATALIGGMGGTLTIEKTDDQPWPKDVGSQSFKIWFVSVGAGLKLKKGKGAKAVGPFKAGETYVGKASSNFRWLPQDFPSQIRVALAEAKAEAGVKVGAQGGFMHILGQGSLPTLEVIFSDTDIGAGGKSVGAGAEIIAGIGKIREKNFKDVEYPVTPDKSDYAVAYHQADDTFFGYNSSLLKEGARKALRTMSAHELVALMSPESTLQIEGHTDVEGKPVANQELSELRAANTQQALVDILGSRLQCQVTAKGYGETVAAKAGETRRNQDRRRVDLKLNGRLVLRLRDK